MYHPNELIQDILAKLDHFIREYRFLLEKNKNLESENKTLTLSLEEAIKQQELLNHRLETIRQDTLRDTKGLDQWKNETRKEIRSIMKDVDKCIPQVESMLEKS